MNQGVFYYVLRIHKVVADLWQKIKPTAIIGYFSMNSTTNLQHNYRFLKVCFFHNFLPKWIMTWAFRPWSFILHCIKNENFFSLYRNNHYILLFDYDCYVFLLSIQNSVSTWIYRWTFISGKIEVWEYYDSTRVSALTDASIQLDEFLKDGREIDMDEEALRLYKKELDEDYLNGILRVGWCLLFGKGVVKKENIVF